MHPTNPTICSRRDFLKSAAASVPAIVTVNAKSAKPLLAATPPMGWNSYNHFKNQIDDATIRAQADAMVTSGMKGSDTNTSTWTKVGEASGTPRA